MHISKIHIEGFRNFKSQEILFNDGVNVIIGHNNSGKTNLLKALALVIDNQGGQKSLSVDDFYKPAELEQLLAEPPQITITVTITQSNDEDLNGDDLVTVSNWLIKLEPPSPYEAQLTYKFFLPEKHRESSSA